MRNFQKIGKTYSSPLKRITMDLFAPNVGLIVWTLLSTMFAAGFVYAIYKLLTKKDAKSDITLL